MTLKKFICLSLYYGIARYLPQSHKRFYGWIGLHSRRFLCRRIFLKMGGEFLSFALYTVGLMSYHTLTGQFGKLKYSRTVLKALFDGLRGCNGPINYV